MNNQNTNGLNGLNGENVNPTPTPMPEVPNLNTTPMQNNGNTMVNENGIGKESVEPVKPTLDSILNGTPIIHNNVETDTTSNIVSTPMEARPIIEEPVVEQVSSVNPVADIPIVDTSATSINEVPVVPTAPIIETIPDTPNMSTMQNTTQTMNESVETNSLGTEILNSSISPADNETSNVMSTIEDPTTIQTTTSIEQPAVETLDASVEPNTTQNLEAVPPVVPTPQDDFGAVPVPPVFDDGKKKKKEKKERNPKDSKKTIIVLLLIVLIAAIGFGVYYFLTMAKASANQASIVLKDVKIELGEGMSSNIEDYATITGYDKENCSIDLSNVDVKKVSTYKYKVTCGKASGEGTIIVDDTMAPKVSVQDVILLPNATLNAEDFIEKCTDASSCSYKFAEDYTGLTEKIGEYEVQIIASDNFNNETKINAKLTISRTAPVKYLTCTAKEETLEEIPATLVHSYRIGVDAKDNFYNAVRTSLFTYNTLEDYNSAIRSYDASVGIQGIIGTEVLNEAEKSIAIRTNKTLKEMNQDVNGNLPENASILRAYLSGIGYTCN